MPDVNVLVCAHRADERAHVAYRRWLTELVDGPQPFALSALMAVGFVRIVTNPRILNPPTPIEAALAVIDGLAAHPRCRLVSPGDDHWRRVSQLAARPGSRATQDFAAFARHGLTWKHLALE